MISYENGDVKIQIQHFQFLVSSSKMSQTSPEFHRLFTTQSGLVRDIVELPDEDPLVFHLICQLVHGFFIPQASISLPTLVRMADVVQRYKILATSRVYNTVAYSYLIQTLRPETSSVSKLLMLFRVARVLGSAKMDQLIQDVFLLHPLQFKALPTEQIAGSYDTEYALLLNLALRSAACRAEVACTLLKLLSSDDAHHLQEKSKVAVWILEDSPSLQEIDARVRSMRRAANLEREQLLDASGSIKEATAEIHCHVCTTSGDDGEANETRTKEVIQLDTCHEVRRLEVRIAEDGKTSRNPADVDVMDLECVSSSSTDFEDIEAYSEPVETMFGSYMHFDEDVSVTSAQTI